MTTTGQAPARKRVVTPEEFCETFMAGTAFCMIEPRTQRTLCWGERLAEVSKNPTLLRAVMISDPISYVADLAKALELECRTDYGMFDAVLYEKQSSRATRPGDSAEGITVAIEYKANPVESHQGIVRLFMARAPLRVMITFPANVEESHKLLRDYAEIVATKAGSKEVAAGRQYAVIFGFAEEGDLRFSYYVFRNGEFESWSG